MMARRAVEDIRSLEFVFAGRAGKSVLRHRRGRTVFSQGDAADAVFYVMDGMVILSVVSSEGKEAVVETLGPGEFFGADCILEQAVRLCSAVTLDHCTLMRIERSDLKNHLRHSPDFSESFLRHLLIRNNRMRLDLAEQLFSCSERRLLRALLVLARDAQSGADSVSIPRVSQSTLAAMVGTTRSRISYFLGRFRKMGLITNYHGVRVNKAMIKTLLSSDPPETPDPPPSAPPQPDHELRVAS
jgi:CRP/FNR family cyclic AMP-dependent transcriptional regulator